MNIAVNPDIIQAEERAYADRLRQAQASTLAAPRRRYGLATRLLIKGMDPVYGRSGSFAKYQVLELVARVPYQSWERIAYLAISRVHRDLGLARRIHDRLADLVRQIGCDERQHKDESLARLSAPRLH